MQELASKIDLWLLAVLVATVAVSLVATLYTLRRGGAVNYIAAFILSSTCIALPLWLLLGTKYVVQNQVLSIRSDPFSWTIPIEEISAIVETRDSRSSPALSLDRLRIEYADGKTVMVSPADKHAFIQSLKTGEDN